jgi:hypothetical protein
MAKFAWCLFAKTTANCSTSFYHFHFISSVSRPLISYSNTAPIKDDPYSTTTIMNSFKLIELSNINQVSLV